MVGKKKFCTECGTKYLEDSYDPDECMYKCSNSDCKFPLSWDNPIPVSVVLIPWGTDREDLLAVVRSPSLPGGGKKSPPGGFLVIEDLRDGGAREVKEEAFVSLHYPDMIRPVFHQSTPDGKRVLLFGVYDGPYTQHTFEVTDESVRRTVIKKDTPVDEIAFPIHADVIKRYFQGELR